MERSESIRKLHTRMRLWEFQDQYVIEPTDGTANSFLAISRLDGSMNLIGDLPQLSTDVSLKVRPLFGVVGMLKLIAGTYLVVIMDAECVGSYWGHAIFKVSSLQILPCDISLNRSTSEEKKMESDLLSIINTAERTSGLFFSYDVNLTLSAQRLSELSEDSKALPLWRQADPRFLWNNYMMEAFIDNKLDQYVLPVIQGSYNHFQAEIGKNNVNITLIARRCTRRTGTRMWRRGADSEGYTANFVESEQIMQSNGYTASFVQVRGSMPFLWEQIVDLTYKPGFEIVRPEEATRVAERHFLDLRKRYGSVLAVDLVNKHGGEGRLCEKYGSCMEPIVGDDLRYVHFDFHRICGHIHFEKLSILYEQIEDTLKKHGYFLRSPTGERLEQQHGVVRTNCIDCLDRTNVTQNMIGRKILESQLIRIGFLNAGESISLYPKFDSSYKILWANHGDDISIQYSGTPALKGDFVRFGKRTIQGILNDLWNALARYYLNNFADGRRQDAIDLLHGHYIVSVSREISSPFQKQWLDVVASLKVAMFLIVMGIGLALMSLRKGPATFSNIGSSMMWGIVSLFIAKVVKSNGRRFTDRPRLNKPRC